MDIFLPNTSVKTVIDIIHKKARFGDALMANILYDSMSERTVFVSWDTFPFKQLISASALTPEEFFQEKKLNDLSSRL